MSKKYYSEQEKERDWTWKYVPVGQHHSGQDEGYYYEWCHGCDKETEHDDGACLECE